MPAYGGVGAPSAFAGPSGPPPPSYAGPPGAPPAGFGPGGPPPSFGGPPPSGPPSGLGAALAGGFDSGPAPGGPTTNGSRPLPAWFDLTGANPHADPGPPAGPSDHDPLPQRRPGQWGAEPEVPPIPRPAPPPPEARAPMGPPGAGPPPAPLSLPTMPPAGSAPAGPPAAARPPVWPPVAETPPPLPPIPPPVPPEMVPSLPESLSASLDMTSELPRVGAGDAPSAPSRYADDLTMELPIFREVESAWFRSSATSPVDQPAESDPWPGVPVDSGAVDSGAMAAPAATHRYARTESPVGGEESWRSAADDGWLAAQAAAEPEDGGLTDTGLPKRVPMAQLVPGGVDTTGDVSDRRSPDAVRGLLSAYHRGVQRGRDAQGKAESTSAGSQTSGKEHEA